MEAHLAEAVIHGSVVHHVPGRLRIKILNAPVDDHCFKNIEQVIASISGVISVRMNAHSSSIIVDYQQSDSSFYIQLQLDQKLKSCLLLSQHDPLTSPLGDITPPITPYSEQHSRIAEVIVSAAEYVDVGLRQATNGYFDLKVLLPLGIAIGSSLHRSRGRGTPMWITLSTFAFNSFMTLHHQRIDMPIVQIISSPERRA